MGMIGSPDTWRAFLIQVGLPWQAILSRSATGIRLRNTNPLEERLKRILVSLRISVPHQCVSGSIDTQVGDKMGGVLRVEVT